MNILILGASGFIGRNMMEYFATKGHKILAHGKSRMPGYSDKLIAGDIKLVGQFDLTTQFGVTEVFQRATDYFKEEPYTVIQAAATTSGANDTIHKPYYHVTDNAVMNSLILREELSHNINRHIFFSCTVMFSAKTGMVNEETVINELDPKYFGVGWTKVYLEKMCEFYSKISKTKFTAIRHSNIYGPYDKYDLEKSHFFGATVNKATSGKNGEDLIVWGDGKDERDFLYIKDLCYFVEKIFNGVKSGHHENNFELFVVGSEKNYTTNEIVSKIIEHAKTNKRILNDVSKPSIPINFKLKCDKVKEYYGWLAETPIDVGIAITLDWYKKYYNIGKI